MKTKNTKEGKKIKKKFDISPYIKNEAWYRKFVAGAGNLGMLPGQGRPWEGKQVQSHPTGDKQKVLGMDFAYSETQGKQEEKHIHIWKDHKIDGLLYSRCVECSLWSPHPPVEQEEKCDHGCCESQHGCPCCDCDENGKLSPTEQGTGWEGKDFIVVKDWETA